METTDQKDVKIAKSNDSAKDSEKSLLDELDRLEVIEAEELQEGVAFHAFRFTL